MCDIYCPQLFSIKSAQILRYAIYNNINEKCNVQLNYILIYLVLMGEGWLTKIVNIKNSM